MPERIPRHKQVRIVQLYYAGNSEVETASRVGLPQSTVSNEIKRFINEAKVSLEDTCRKYGVSDVLKELHYLSIQIEKKGLDIADCVAAVSVYQQLEDLGKTTDDLGDLLSAIDRMRQDPATTSAAIRLHKLEEESGKGYQKVVADFETKKARAESLTKEIEGRQGKIKEMEEQQLRLSGEIEESERRLLAVNTELNRALSTGERLKRLKIERVESLARLIEEYECLGFDREQVKELADQKEELAAEGIQLGEFKTFLKERGTLQEQIARLRQRKKKLEDDVANVELQWDMWHTEWESEWIKNQSLARLKSLIERGSLAMQCKYCKEPVALPIFRPEHYRNGMGIQCQHCWNLSLFSYWELVEAISKATLQALETMTATDGQQVS